MEGETINVTSGRFDYVIRDEINIMGESGNALSISKKLSENNPTGN
ncbi:MAG: hypothetical protein PF436_01280 [Prolixibacteraceae bacterium]|jgi:hypothetical protein|nr:hypothetical protein [Prolixibacteraceae bacterium]